MGSSLEYSCMFLKIRFQATRGQDIYVVQEQLK
jgi:hypothetical protein